MTTSELEHEIRQISVRLKAIDKDTPEMTGMDWASDHGWISQDEWESAGKQSQRGVELQNAEVARVESLREQFPQAMLAFLDQQITRAQTAVADLKALKKTWSAPEGDFPMNFNLSLLDSIITGLVQFRNREKPKHWEAWLWRVAFSIVEESEAYIQLESGASED